MSIALVIGTSPGQGPPTPEHVRRRLVLALVALVVLALPSAGQAKATKHRSVKAHAAVICASASATPSEESLAAIRRTTLCLLNAERAKHGLRALKPSLKLRHASGATPRRWSPTASSPTALLRPHQELGLPSGVHAYTVGENIAWGGGPVASPGRIVKMWMNSPPHRANILSRTYVHIGIGVVRGTPPGMAGGTYTTDFGYRR